MGALDLLVLGSGVAGLSAAVRAAAAGLAVGVLTKAELHQSATRWAQGGVAAVLGADDGDSPDAHLADTLSAGAGLCDLDAVRVLVDEGPGRVEELIRLGAVFDRDAAGDLARAREGGHSHARVVHAGGAATGAEIERALVDAVGQTASAVMECWFALDFVVAGDRCAGVVALDPSGNRVNVTARNTLLATGGAGQLFAVTTNPPQATGDGIAMALRAGVAVADVEFMQFHPTALHHPAMPRPLLSEALRGHGALIRDSQGRQFVDELLPRDQVARAVTARMLDEGTEHCWLDATHLEDFAARFPTIAASVAAAGLDPSRDWLPIAPAAHYLSGGAVTDLCGATTLPGLWAAGETACTGVHGANRLASNSLLEAMVFAHRVLESIFDGREGPEPTGVMRAVLEGNVIRCPSPQSLPPSEGTTDTAKARDRLQRALTAGAGVLRSAESLDGSTAEVRRVAAAAPPPAVPEDFELANLLTVSQALLVAAGTREESRGSHTRTDFPETTEAFRCRILH